MRGQNIKRLVGGITIAIMMIFSSFDSFAFGNQAVLLYKTLSAMQEAQGATDKKDVYVVPDIFFDDFEEGLSKWDELENENGQGGGIVKDPLNPSNNVFESYTWAGDDPNIRPRSEIRVDNYEEIGKDYWYSWRFMIDPAATNNSASEIIGQWHTKPDFENGEDWDNWKDGSFTAALVVDPNTGELRFSATHMDIIELPTNMFPENGKWHTIMWHIKHSTGEDGYVEAWIDGEPLLPFNGEDNKVYGVTAYNSSGSYLKLGTYRYNYTSWQNPVEFAQGESRMYYDDVKVGSSIESKESQWNTALSSCGNATFCDMLFDILLWLNMPNALRVY